MAILDPFENMNDETIRAGLEADINSRFGTENFRIERKKNFNKRVTKTSAGNFLKLQAAKTATA